MRREEAEGKNIRVYWWNFGKKTLEFKGTYGEYFTKRDIKVTDITHPFDILIHGWRFEVSTSSTTITIDEYGPDYLEGCNDIIKAFLLLTGDKAKLITPNKEFNINW